MVLRRRSSARDPKALAAQRLTALAERLDRTRGSVDSAARLAATTHLTVDDPGAGGPGRHAARAGRTSAGLLRSGHQVAIVALVVALAAVFAGWQVLRSAPEPVPVEMSGAAWQVGASGSTGADATPSPAGAVSSTAGEQSETIVVDVTGKVRRPGIVELPVGARVIDALTAAGGARGSADTSTLNLARVLSDGEQIVVGDRDAVPVPGAVATTEAPTTPAMVNINTAGAEQLETLPGVGPVTAAAIIQWRTDNGGFAVVDDLLDVSGIGDATLEELKPYVLV